MNIQTVNFKNTSFVNVTNPGPIELKYLKNNFNVSGLHLDDYANKTQVPKIEISKDYTLIVLDFPFFNLSGSVNNNNSKSQDKKNPLSNLLNFPQATLSSVSIPQIISSGAEKTKRIFATQVDFFIGKDYLVIIHEGTLPPINDVFSLCQKALNYRNKFMADGPVFLAYSLIDALVDTCFPVINEISSTIDKIDKQLEKKPSPDTIEDISLTRRNIVVFHTMIKPMLPIFRDVEEGRYKQLNGMMQPFWSNVLDHLQKIWDRLEDSRELIEGIAESNESLLSFRNNELVKFFTIITSISFPFIIINNLYSMNVTGLPYAQNPLFVWFLFGIIFAAGLGIIIYFKFRGWI